MNPNNILNIFLILFLVVVFSKVVKGINQFGKGAGSLFGQGSTDEEAKLLASNVLTQAGYDKAMEYIRTSKGAIQGNWAKWGKIDADVKAIDKAIGWATENEDAIIGVLKSYGNKLQLCQLAKRYREKTGNDLQNAIKKALSEGELNQVNDYVNTLPEGFIKRKTAKGKKKK